MKDGLIRPPFKISLRLYLPLPPIFLAAVSNALKTAAKMMIPKNVLVNSAASGLSGSKLRFAMNVSPIGTAAVETPAIKTMPITLSTILLKTIGADLLLFYMGF